MNMQVHSFRGDNSLETAKGKPGGRQGRRPRKVSTHEMQDTTRALLELYSAARNGGTEEFQDRALELLRKLIPFDFATWGAGSVPPKGIEMHTVHRYGTTGDQSRQYEKVRHLDRRYDFLHKQSAGVVNVHVPSLFAGARDRPIREFLVRHGRVNSLIGAQMHDGGPLITWVALHRAKEAMRFQAGERDLLEELFPHMNLALSLNRFISLQQLKAQAGAKFAFAVVDQRAYLYHATSDFVPLLRAEWPRFGGRVLPAELGTSLLAGPQRFVGQEVVVELHSQESPAIVKARPRGRVDLLSGREAAIARKISEGLSYKEIAKALALAPTTVRNHTQAIYGKLKVRNKAELTSLMLDGH